MIKAVIFDMDGVIIDSEPIYYTVMQKLAIELGFPMGREEYDRYVGTASKHMWAELKTLHNLNPEVEDLQEKEAMEYLQQLESFQQLQPIEGIVELLKDLHKSQIKTALASSSSHHNINTVLRILDLQESFPVIVSGEDVTASKPAPDIFLRAARMLGVEPGECVVIEDAHHGVTAATRAGMFCIGYQNGNSGQQDLSGATQVVRSIRQIDSHLLQKLH